MPKRTGRMFYKSISPQGSGFLNWQPNRCCRAASVARFSTLHLFSHFRVESRCRPMTKALANEWASKGINVNAIAPGYMATDNTEALRRDETGQPADS